MILMGDLNYRVEQEPEKVIGLIDNAIKGDSTSWDKILEYDQLAKNMAIGEAFPTFRFIILC